MGAAALALAIVALGLGFGASALAVVLLWRHASLSDRVHDQMKELELQMVGRIDGGLDAADEEVSALRERLDAMEARLAAIESDVEGSLRAILEDLHNAAEWLSTIDDRTKVLEEGGVVMPQRAADEDE